MRNYEPLLSPARHRQTLPRRRALRVLEWPAWLASGAAGRSSPSRQPSRAGLAAIPIKQRCRRRIS